MTKNKCGFDKQFIEEQEKITRELIIGLICYLFGVVSGVLIGVLI